MRLFFKCLQRMMPVYACMISLAVAEPKSSIQTDFAEAGKAMAAGQFLVAVEFYKDAAAISRKAELKAEQAISLYNLGIAYHALGNQKLAAATLQEARELADGLSDVNLQVKIEGLQGRVDDCSDGSISLDRLTPALEQARKLGNAKTLAELLNDQGTILVGKGMLVEATEAFAESLKLAEKKEEKELAARVALNGALIGFQEQEFTAELLAQTEKKLMDAKERVGRLGENHTKAFLLTSLGEAFRTLAENGNLYSKHDWMEDAFESFSAAAQLAAKLENKRVQSEALGGLARIYEFRGRFAEALKLTVEARALAQSLPAADLLFQWEWQAGRLLTKTNQPKKALDAYIRARNSLAQIRHDASIGFGSRRLGKSFRETIGGMFFEMASLVLQQADAEKNPEVLQTVFRQTREIVESFKSAELEDYFQDECISQAFAKRREVDDVAAETAVFYIIPLVNRTEILVSTGSQIHRFTSPIKGAELNKIATNFRNDLERRGTYRFIDGAKKLYDVLIRPTDALLVKQKIRTLVFVPDGSLRTAPMAALYDGEKFLIQKYALAVTPGLQLMDPQPTPRTDAKILIGALSEGVQNFAPLENVNDEVAGVSQVMKGDVLVNAQFQKAVFTKNVTSGEADFIHIASHGEFSGDSSKTFVLTYDGKINLNELEQMIRPRQFAGKPVQLLCLSACKTAAGDDRAAMGLAGIAIKSGARSALATLWYVNDSVSSSLIQSFYRRLQADPTISKAEALQRAQVEIMEDLRFQHPSYWAPYLIIGNWL